MTPRFAAGSSTSLQQVTPSITEVATENCGFIPLILPHPALADLLPQGRGEKTEPSRSVGEQYRSSSCPRLGEGSGAGPNGVVRRGVS